MKTLKELILKGYSDDNMSTAVFDDLLSQLASRINEYYTTIYEIHSRYDAAYITEERKFLYGLYNPSYNPEFSKVKIQDFHETHVTIWFRYHDNDINDTTYYETDLSWDELINFDPLTYEWNLCKEVRQKMFEELTITQNKIHQLHKLISKNDVRYGGLKTLINQRYGNTE